MALAQDKRAFGVFTSRAVTEEALNELKNSGFPMQKVSIVAKHAESRDAIAGVDVQDESADGLTDGVKAGAVAGAATGGLFGLIGGLSLLSIFGLGPILAGGVLAALLGETLVGGAIGAATGGMLAALLSLGVSEDLAKIYSDRLHNGDYLLMLDGTEEEINRAEPMLRQRGIEDWGVYDAATFDLPVGFANAYPTGVSGLGMGMDTVPYPLTAATPDASLGKSKLAVGVFSNRQETEDALHELKNSDFPMHKVSILARHTDKDDEIAGVQVGDRVDDSKIDEGAMTGAAAGGALGTLTGLLVGLGALAIPGVGPLAIAGATATALATTLTGGALGALAGSLVGGFIGLGIPEERAKVYNELVSRGKYLVMVDGKDEEIARAETVLSDRGIQEWGIYDAPDTTKTVDSDNREVPTATVDSDYKISNPAPNVTIIDRRDNIV